MGTDAKLSTTARNLENINMPLSLSYVMLSYLFCSIYRSLMWMNSGDLR